MRDALLFYDIFCTSECEENIVAASSFAPYTSLRSSFFLFPFYFWYSIVARAGEKIGLFSRLQKSPRQEIRETHTTHGGRL